MANHNVERATQVVTCVNSGAILGANEAQTTVRCSCGFVANAEPRLNRRVAGEVVPGWTVRLPAHKVRVD